MDPLTKTAITATLHCLTGCAIGEVLGMVLGMYFGLGEWPTVGLAVLLAFFFGYLFTFTPVIRSGMGLKAALKTTLAADTVSISVMEIIDNAIMLIIPGAMNAGLMSGVFWGSLAFALFAAFWITVPVNRWLIARGKGHAVVHSHHHEH